MIPDGPSLGATISTAPLFELSDIERIVDAVGLTGMRPIHPLNYEQFVVALSSYATDLSLGLLQEQDLTPRQLHKKAEAVWSAGRKMLISLGYSQPDPTNQQLSIHTWDVMHCLQRRLRTKGLAASST